MYKTDDIGMLIIIPIKPNIEPPINTATSAQRAGSPTDLPTILGYVKLSSNTMDVLCVMFCPRRKVLNDIF